VGKTNPIEESGGGEKAFGRSNIRESSKKKNTGLGMVGKGGDARKEWVFQQERKGWTRDRRGGGGGCLRAKDIVGRRGGEGEGTPTGVGHRGGVAIRTGRHQGQKKGTYTEQTRQQRAAAIGFGVKQIYGRKN